MPTLGQQLKALRVKNGMTQEQLAQKLNTTKAAISRYEKDQRQPRLEQITEIAKILEATPYEAYDLFFRSQNLQDGEDERGTAYFNTIFKFVEAPTTEVDNSTAGNECDENLDDDSSPFSISRLSDDELEKHFLLIFRKLDRFHMEMLYEDAEIYLEFQEKRNEKKQILSMEGG